MIKVSLKNSSAIYFSKKESTLSFINTYALEHLIVSTRITDYVLNNLKNAGSVFIGNYSPESLGNYITGNHTLPINGYARMYSGVGLESFQKTISFQEVSKKELRVLSKSAQLMAQAEGLEAHKQAISIRLKNKT